MNKPFAVTGATFVSPKGKALWCKVTEPDRKFDPEGTLSTSLVLNPESPDVKAFIESLEELQDKAYTETVESLGAKGSSKVILEGLESNHLIISSLSPSPWRFFFKSNFSFFDLLYS